VLLKEKNISVRNKKEKIQGVSNYVIDATTERGTYTVWIDPEHGYNFSKVIAHRQPGDRIFSSEFKAKVNLGEEYLTGVEVTKFQEIEGVWIPSETTMEDHRRYANGDYINITESFKVLSMQINPDHDTLGSFLMDDIRNGASVIVKGDKGKEYIWQDGKVVDKAGKVLDLRDRQAADPNQTAAGEEKNGKNVVDNKNPEPFDSLSGKKLPGLETLNLPVDPNAIGEQAVLLCFCDMGQRPSRHGVEELVKRAEELKGKGVWAAVVQTEPVGQKELEEWRAKYQIPFPVGMIGEEGEKVLAGWGVRGQPWLILADRQQVVRAEGFGVEELGEKMKMVTGE